MWLSAVIHHQGERDMAGVETRYEISIKISKVCGERRHAVESNATNLGNVNEVEALIEQLLTAVRGLPNGALTHNWTGTREGIN
jgi:hypothetical protein